MSSQKKIPAGTFLGALPPRSYELRSRAGTAKSDKEAKAEDTGAHRALASRAVKPSRDFTPSAVRRKDLLMPKKRYQMLAVDLDGTLLDHAGIPHARDVRAIHALRSHNIPVTIITGRLFSGTKPSAAALGITGPVGCADGSQIMHAESGDTLVHHAINGDCAAVIADVFGRERLSTFLFAGNTIVHDDGGDAFLPYVKLWSNDIQHAPRVLDHASLEDGSLTATVALGTERSIQAAVAHLKMHAPSLQIASFAVKKLGEMWGCIVRGEGGTKGTALAWLARHHGVEMDATVCVGDWLNDVPMMSVAGRSFAMGQAPDAVKAVVSDVLTETSAEGGGIATIARTVFGVDVE